MLANMPYNAFKMYLYVILILAPQIHYDVGCSEPNCYGCILLIFFWAQLLL